MADREVYARGNELSKAYALSPNADGRGGLAKFTIDGMDQELICDFKEWQNN